MILGDYQKMVIADNCAWVSIQSREHQQQSGLELIMGAIFIRFQIYGDSQAISESLKVVANLDSNLNDHFRTPYLAEICRILAASIFHSHTGFRIMSTSRWW